MTVVQLSEQDLRRLHQVQLEMLRDLDRVCRLLGVEYQLGAGSLLGAIRHGGFIPWDDDVDVVMLRADYRRFLREAPPLLEQRLFLQTWRSDPHFHAGFAKLRCHGSSFREEGCQHTRQHHGIFIDIFPFDPVCPGRWWGRILLALVVWMRKIIDLAGDVGSARLTGGRTSWRLQLRSILHRGLALVPFPFWMAVQETLLRALSLAPARHVVCLVSGPPCRRRFRLLARPVTEFHQTLMLAFEGLSLPVTASYHEALTRLYGDYMLLPPPERRMPRHPVVEFRLPL